MRFGICLNAEELDKIEIAHKVGFDYIELSFAGLEKTSNEDIGRCKKLLDELDMPCLAMRHFIPKRFNLIGENNNRAEALDFVKVNLEKVKVFVCHIFVFGSGPSRMCPDGYDKEKANEEICRFIKDVSPVLKKYDSILAVEELTPEVTNTLNSCDEVLRLVDKINLDNITLHIDTYHAGIAGESWRDFENYHKIGYLHLASAKNNRSIPQSGDGEEYEKVFEALKKAGYSKGLASFEGKINGGFEEAIANGLKVVKS